MSPQLPLVSVVIATHNMADYLPAAVQSVLAQTYRRLEVVIVDDGSTDGTEDVLRQFEEDPRIRICRQQKSGQPVAKNNGIRLCTGGIVGFCDADDMWLPDKLAVQVPAFAVAPTVGVVYSKAIRLLQHTQQVETISGTDFPAGRVTKALFVENFVPFGTALVRRECFDNLGMFDERYPMGIDWELWLRLSTRYEFSFVDAITYVYRVWPGQMSGNWKGRYDNAFLIMERFLAEHPEAVDAHTTRLAYADSYTRRARRRSSQSGEGLNALSDVARAIRTMPSFAPAWRCLVHISLQGIGWRRG
jgi:glycosyltransferase involved in cell wall biosynthesis